MYYIDGCIYSHLYKYSGNRLWRYLRKRCEAFSLVTFQSRECGEEGMIIPGCSPPVNSLALDPVRGNLLIENPLR